MRAHSTRIERIATTCECNLFAVYLPLVNSATENSIYKSIQVKITKLFAGLRFIGDCILGKKKKISK